MSVVNKLLLTGILASVIVLSGCAVGVAAGAVGATQATAGEEDVAVLTDRASFALSIDKSELTISDIKSSGIRTDFTVKQTKGGTWNCYVTSAGVMAKIMTGASASDAICSPTNSKSKSKSKSKKTCDALSKKAGKC